MHGSIDTIKEDGGEAFLRQHAWYEQSQLLPLLENSFRRITLVNKHKTERLTIDTGVTFCCLQSGKISSLDNIVIIELKRDGHNSSPIKEILRKLHIQSSGFSKYCIGSALTVSHLKSFGSYRLTGAVPLLPVSPHYSQTSAVSPDRFPEKGSACPLLHE